MNTKSEHPTVGILSRGKVTNYDSEKGRNVDFGEGIVDEQEEIMAPKQIEISEQMLFPDLVSVTKEINREDKYRRMLKRGGVQDGDFPQELSHVIAGHLSDTLDNRTSSELGHANNNDQIDQAMNQIAKIGDDLHRKGDFLEPLIPRFDDIINAIPLEQQSMLASRLDMSKLRADFEASNDLAVGTVGDVEYGWLRKRSQANSVVYLIARYLQQEDFSDEKYALASKKEEESEKENLRQVSSTTEELYTSNQFIQNMNGFGLETEDEDLQKGIAEFEQRFGKYYLTVLLGIFDGSFSMDDVTPYVHKKYGIPDINGNDSCGYCDKGACGCGGTKNNPDPENSIKMKRNPVEDMKTYGLKEMSNTMESVYGRRNSALGPLAGFVRASAELFGEYNFAKHLRDCGSLEKYLDKFGVTVDTDSSYIKEHHEALHGTEEKQGALKEYCTKNDISLEELTNEKALEIEGEIIEVTFLKEVADVIAWYPLFVITFGLNPTRGVQRALKDIAKKSGCEIHIG